ncbi:MULTISPECIES: hypothetical protein [unclassified Bacillus (in: firmicutes)]|uniref:hypothetical protein n=1 Tax=unclassified Bacillus (in: firmicutes) TaxID=185979 RepID=UPI0014567447|nr:MULTISPECIES: hypothetical protein [unclassified Bacillus (in: firmicutes)]MEA3320468.1 hypothetical protein [Bacillota bacterium]NLP51224.1 hypothetical protein [Bacillus sp. RO1]NMH75246.1 hypothetical protein [Bacillus sp. RO2]
MDFIMDHLLTIIIVLVILFVVIPFLKSILSKLVMIGLILAGLIFFGVLGPDFTESSSNYVENTIRPVVTNEIDKADFHYDEGSKEYKIQSASFHLKGKLNENTGEIRFKDKTYEMDVRFLQDIIEKKVQEQETNQ